MIFQLHQNLISINLKFHEWYPPFRLFLGAYDWAFHKWWLSSVALTTSGSKTHPAAEEKPLLLPFSLFFKGSLSLEILDGYHHSSSRILNFEHDLSCQISLRQLNPAETSFWVQLSIKDSKILKSYFEIIWNSNVWKSHHEIIL